MRWTAGAWPFKSCLGMPRAFKASGDVAEGFGTGPLDRTDDRDDIGRIMVCIRLERGYGSLPGDLVEPPSWMPRSSQLYNRIRAVLQKGAGILKAEIE